MADQHYTYDPLDRIVATGQGAKTVSQRFYNQKRLATDIQGTSTRSVFETGASLLAFHQADVNSRETRLLGTNVQRSVLEVVAPHTTQTIAYTPYGSHSSSEARLSVLGFNGQRPDPLTGHYLLGNGVRAYNPVLMRFNSPDVLSPFQEGGINTYAYCGDDPVNYEDPSGYVFMRFFRSIFGNTSNRRNSVQELPTASGVQNVIAGTPIPRASRDVLNRADDVPARLPGRSVQDSAGQVMDPLPTYPQIAEDYLPTYAEAKAAQSRVKVARSRSRVDQFMAQGPDATRPFRFPVDTSYIENINTINLFRNGFFRSGR